MRAGEGVEIRFEVDEGVESASCQSQLFLPEVHNLPLNGGLELGLTGWVGEHGKGAIQGVLGAGVFHFCKPGAGDIKSGVVEDSYCMLVENVVWP